MLVFGYIKSNNDNIASQEGFPQTYANAAQEVKIATPVELEDTNDPEKLSQYGNELLHAGNYEQSIEYFDKSLSIKYNETVLNRKANALLQLQNNKGAMECIDAVLKNNSTNAVALDMKGSCLVNLDKFDQSIEYFDRSLSIRYNEKVLLRKSAALFHLYNYEGAIECANAILKNNSTNTDALGVKAMSFTKMGDFNQGIKYIDMAIQINPEDQMLIKTKNAINAEREKQENIQANENSNDQYYDLRFEDYTDLAGGRVLYAYANSYDASEAKANSLAETCGSGSNVRANYDAVMVYLTDLNTGVLYEGDYKITDFYG